MERIELNMTTIEEINQYLKELFEAHGIIAKSQGNWLAFNEAGVKVNGEIFERPVQKHGLTIQLDIRVQIGDRTLIESFAGVGKEKEEAVQDALQNFITNSLHVITAAFFDPHDKQVTRETWIISGQERTVIIGDVGTRGKVPSEKSLHTAWFKHLEKLIKNANLSEDIHWIRMYYAQMKNQQLACEVRLDNMTWEQIQEEMAAYDWPKSQDFFSLRLFMIIQGTTTQTSRK